MPNGTDEHAPEVEVPLRSLPTKSSHRTSAPTDEALRELVATVTLHRAGRKPSADLVIFAALQLAAAGGTKTFADRITEIESARFPATPQAESS
jgi:hypothetical protein